MAIADFRKENTKRDDGRSQTIEVLKPSAGYVNPCMALHPAWGPNYTSGTMQQALTGNYYNYRPDTGLSDSRPIGHGKSWGNGRSALVFIGNAVPGASRGVGQPTIDGFLTGNAGLKQAFDNDIKQAVLQEFIRQAVAHQAEQKTKSPRGQRRN